MHSLRDRERVTGKSECGTVTKRGETRRDVRVLSHHQPPWPVPGRPPGRPATPDWSHGLVIPLDHHRVPNPSLVQVVSFNSKRFHAFLITQCTWLGLANYMTVLYYTGDTRGAIIICRLGPVVTQLMNNTVMIQPIETGNAHCRPRRVDVDISNR
ncbi:hypothetical protein ElyMa_003868300 [Elysia marginata]|uniref:Uncharacterized protein n=1 Tax=Elysia marginata TaxID=1093978 RepID=A0AAV4FJH8_9GAST|nr:hypothetical protein ElyMa_003868300 [Elysia marginata]